MNIIEITSQNHQEFKGLDVVAFSLAHAGAQGEGGVSILLLLMANCITQILLEALR